MQEKITEKISNLKNRKVSAGSRTSTFDLENKLFSDG